MKNLLIQQTVDQLTMTLEMLQSSHQEMIQSIPQNHPERQDLITSSENDLTKLQDLINQWKFQIEPTQEFPNLNEALELKTKAEGEVQDTISLFYDDEYQTDDKMWDLLQLQLQTAKRRRDMYFDLQDQMELHQDQSKALMFWCLKYMHLMVCNDNDQLAIVCDQVELGEGELFDAFETLSQTYGFSLEDE